MRSLPFSNNRSTAASIASFSSSVSITPGSARLSIRPYFLGSIPELAVAVTFPPTLVVFLMRKYLPDQNCLLPVVDLRHQPVVVAPNVENRAVANRVCVGIYTSQLSQVLPLSPACDPEPFREGVFGVRVVRPELPEWPPNNDVHI